jgi:hypothetical protein
MSVLRIRPKELFLLLLIYLHSIQVELAMLRRTLRRLTANVESSVSSANGSNFSLSASEAPHLLLPAEEKRPFFTAHQARAFTASALIGAGFVVGVYFMLAESLAESTSEDKAALQSFIQRRIPAKVEKVSAVVTESLPEFVTPSCYDSLVGQAKEGKTLPKATDKLKKDDGESPAVLHQVALYRMKSAWNMTIANLELTLDGAIVQYYGRREIHARRTIQERLEARGLEVVSLEATK